MLDYYVSSTTSSSIRITIYVEPDNYQWYRTFCVRDYDNVIIYDSWHQYTSGTQKNVTFSDLEPDTTYRLNVYYATSRGGQDGIMGVQYETTYPPTATLNLRVAYGVKSFLVQYRTPDGTLTTATINSTSYQTLTVQKSHTPQVIQVNFDDGCSGVKWNYNSSGSTDPSNISGDPAISGSLFDYEISTGYTRYCYMDAQNYPSHQYTVTYHKNFSPDATATQQTSEGSDELQSFTVRFASDMGWSRPDYDFSGWALTPTGEVSTYYIPGDPGLTNKDLDLYAKWTYNPSPTHQYRITLSVNGGTDSSTYISPYGFNTSSGTSTSQGFTIPTIATMGWFKTNCRFKGWATSASSTTVAYSDGYSGTTNVDLTLYAIWETAYVTIGAGVADEIDICSVTMSYTQDGVRKTTTQRQGVLEEVDINSSYTISIQFDSGIHFVRWTYSGGTISTSSFTRTATATVNYYAEYDYYWRCSASVQTKSQVSGVSASVSEAQPLPSQPVTFTCTITNPFYAFDGWYSSNTAITGKVSSNQSYTVTPTSDLSLYARIKFRWYYSDTPAQNHNAIISARDWNGLGELISVRTGQSVLTVREGDYLSASRYNSFVSPLNLPTVSVLDAVSASAINNIVTRVNSL